MNVTYLEQAKTRVPNVQVLVNMVSRRVRQLISGQRPLVKPDNLNMEKMDIALKEIATGKLTVEMLFTAEDLRHREQSTWDSTISL
ncbi:MAG: DNA-directed RNA polymerase subunit omega [Kiritimatiellae bacterium]|nr:DNA-directed RNA polymerase subunit omega [Kiritimatiellia bacterium]